MTSFGLMKENLSLWRDEEYDNEDEDDNENEIGDENDDLITMKIMIVLI